MEVCKGDKYFKTKGKYRDIELYIALHYKCREETNGQSNSIPHVGRNLHCRQEGIPPRGMITGDNKIGSRVSLN